MADVDALPDLEPEALGFLQTAVRSTDTDDCVASGSVATSSSISSCSATKFLVCVNAQWTLVAGQMGIFMPRVYETAGVESATQQNLLQVLLWSFTVLATWFGFMRYGDRVDRRLLYGIGALLGIAAWVLLVFAHVTMPVLILFAVLWAWLLLGEMPAPVQLAGGGAHGFRVPGIDGSGKCDRLIRPSCTLHYPAEKSMSFPPFPRTGGLPPTGWSCWRTWARRRGSRSGSILNSSSEAPA